MDRSRLALTAAFALWTAPALTADIAAAASGSSASAPAYLGVAMPPAAAAPPQGTHCTEGPSIAAAGDEDRFLITGGARRLTGRSLRKGDTYVAEAALGRDQACRPERLQLYVFRNGIFVGAALNHPASPAHGRRILDFDLPDDLHLNYRLADCDHSGSGCDRVLARSALLVHGHGGWTVQRDDAANPDAPRLIRQTPPRYPPEALRQHHQGIVVLRIAIDPAGWPGAMRVIRSSGHPELDQAAIDAAHQWRFRPALHEGKAVKSSASVPVNFSLNTEKQE